MARAIHTIRTIRILLLLLVLATVAQQAWLARTRAVAWNDPLRVAIYPISADDSAATADYIAALRPDVFTPIEHFFLKESRRHGRTIYRPLRLTLAPPIATRPPELPRNNSRFGVISWSLQMRWWAWRNDTTTDNPQVRLFVLFHDPDRHHRLPHSTGLERGMIGLIHAFATPVMAGSNNVVIAHELLHTLGATDKYDLASNQPTYPEGYAEPERSPSLPQEYAEIMAGRIPVTETHAEIPKSLAETLIGPLTATEIGWLDPATTQGQTQ
jgi:hypothetical protein